MSEKARAIGWTLCLAMALLCDERRARADIAVGYASTGHRFLVTSMPPSTWFQPSFDDSGWSAASQPLGGGSGCPLSGSLWPDSTEILIRTSFTLPDGATRVLIGFAVDDEILDVYLNGTRVGGGYVHSGCAWRGSHVVEVPDAIVRSGANTLAVRARNRGGARYYDHEVRYAAPNSPTLTLSFPIENAASGPCTRAGLSLGAVMLFDATEAAYAAGQMIYLGQPRGSVFAPIGNFLQPFPVCGSQGTRDGMVTGLGRIVGVNAWNVPSVPVGASSLVTVAFNTSLYPNASLTYLADVSVSCDDYAGSWRLVDGVRYTNIPVSAGGLPAVYPVWTTGGYDLSPYVVNDDCNPGFNGRFVGSPAGSSIGFVSIVPTVTPRSEPERADYRFVANRSGNWSVELKRTVGGVCEAALLQRSVSAVSTVMGTWQALSPGATYCWEATLATAGQPAISRASGRFTVPALPRFVAGPSAVQAGFDVDVSAAISESGTGTVEYASSDCSGRPTSLSFDGGDVVTIPGSLVGGSSAFSLEAWLKLASSGQTGRIFTSENGGVEASLNGGRFRMRVVTSNAIAVAESAVNAAVGLHTHVAATYDGASLRLYLDGAQRGSISASGAVSSGLGATIGGALGAGFIGELSSFAVYGRALTTSEVVAHVAAGAGVELPSSSGLSAAWQFSEGPGVQSIYDASGNHRAGVLGVDGSAEASDPSRLPTLGTSAAMGTGTTLATRLTGLLGGPTYCYRVLAQTGRGIISSTLGTFTRRLDTTPPMVVANELTVVECTSNASATVALASPIVTDDSDPNPTVRAHLGSPVGAPITFPFAFSLGDTEVWWTATDALGNVGADREIVRVVDRTAPIALGGPELVIDATSPSGTPYAAAPQAASDACTAVSVVNDGPALYPIGVTTVSFIVRDGSGNVATVSRNVRIVDRSPPVFSSPSIDTDGDGLVDSAEDADADGIRDPGETDPRSADTDGDGFSDGIERANGSDPLSPASSPTVDLDGDGLSDAAELARGTNASVVDTDGDGISDGVEVQFGTNPLAQDTDGDGIPDGVEDADRDGMWGPGETDAKVADTDGDGVVDGVEDANQNGRVDAGETDARSFDTDGDGFSDGLEVMTTGTNPRLADSDGDGLVDSTEDPNGDGVVDPGETNARNADSDGDGASDGAELINGTDPLSAASVPSGDADGDGLADTRETLIGTQPALADSDGDGLSDGSEVLLGTNPLAVDTDGDGLGDGLEVAAGLDPASTDSDRDGIGDDVEDVNRNGVVDPGETDPKNTDTDGDAFHDGLEESLGTNPRDATSLPGGQPIDLAPLTVGHDGTSCFQFSPPPPTLTDNSDAASLLSATFTGAPSCWDLGTYTITWTAIDRSGNVAVARQVIRVVPGTLAVSIVGLEVGGSLVASGRYHNRAVVVIFDVAAGAPPYSVALSPSPRSLTSTGNRYRAEYDAEGAYPVVWIQARDAELNGGSTQAPPFGIDRTPPVIETDLGLAQLGVVLGDATTYPFLFFGEWVDLERMRARDGETRLSSMSGTLDFDGVDDVAEIPHSASFAVASALTVEAWVRRVGTRESALVDKSRSDGSAPGFSLGVSAANRARFELSVDGQAVIVTGGPVAIGRWQHVAATYDGRVARVYVNGLPSGQRYAAGAVDPGIGPLHLGRRILGAMETQGLEGELADVALWNTALSEREIASHYRGGIGRPIAANGTTVAVYHFGESGQTLVDGSGRGNHGTLGRSPAAESGDPTRGSASDPEDLRSSGVVSFDATLSRTDGTRNATLVSSSIATSGAPLLAGARQLGGAACTGATPCTAGDPVLTGEQIRLWDLNREAAYDLEVRAVDAAGNAAVERVSLRTRSYEGALEDAIAATVQALLDPFNSAAATELEDALAAFAVARRYADLPYDDGSYLRADQGMRFLEDAETVGVVAAETLEGLTRAVLGDIRLYIVSIGGSLLPEDVMMYRDAESYLTDARFERFRGFYGATAALARTGLERVDLLYPPYQTVRAQRRQVRARWEQLLDQYDSGFSTAADVRLDALRIAQARTLMELTRDVLRDVVHGEIDRARADPATTERVVLDEILDVIDKSSADADEAGDLISVGGGLGDACLDLLALFMLPDDTFTRCYLRMNDMATTLDDVVEVLVPASRWRAGMALALFNMLELSLFVSPTGLPWVSSDALSPPNAALVLPDARSAEITGSTPVSSIDVNGTLASAYRRYDEAFAALSAGDVEGAFRTFVENRCLLLTLYNRYYSANRTTPNVADPKEPPIVPESVGCSP